jgi:hypothetical protein
VEQKPPNWSSGEEKAAGPAEFDPQAQMPPHAPVAAEKVLKHRKCSAIIGIAENEMGIGNRDRTRRSRTSSILERPCFGPFHRGINLLR